MNRDDFTSLPIPLALGLLWDIAQAKLENLERPNVPRSPKYDDRFTRKKGQFCWVSEMTLDSLEFWRRKKAEGAAAGGQYADSDGKWVAKFDKWIEWRRLFPYEEWSGTRGEDRANGAPPSKDPALHAWGPRNGETSAPAPAPAATDYGGGADDEDSIPF